MLKIYISYNCSSCKKVISWFEEKGIEYEVYNFFSKSLTPEEIKFILKYTENGFDDIISDRSKIYEKHKQAIENMSIDELVDFIIDYPSVLKRPIIVDTFTDNLIVGYNKYDLQTFI